MGLSGEKYAEVAVSAKVVNIKFLPCLTLVSPPPFIPFLMEVGSSRKSRTTLLTFRMIWSGGIFFEMRDSQCYRAGSTIKGDIERACGVLLKESAHYWCFMV